MMMLYTYFLASLLFDFNQVLCSKKLQICNAKEHNVVSCRMEMFYTDYQVVKCFTKDEIKSLSGEKYVCQEPATHCWYNECQLRLTSLAFEPNVRQQCKCTDASKDFCKHSIDLNKRRCIKLIRYDSWQWATCKASRDLILTAQGACNFPETHCWYPCQSETFHEFSGTVSDNCKCSSESSLNFSGILVLFLQLILTYHLVALMHG